jgi:iron complex transport system substrate-binding protein
MRISHALRRLSIVPIVIVALAGCIAPPPSAPAPASAPAIGSITVTDALDRQVVFEQPPQRIALAGKSLFMVADAVYLFPEAAHRIAAIGLTAQGNLDFIPVIDPTYRAKVVLQKDAGAEQIAAVQPDAVILKSNNAGTLGATLAELEIPVIYVDFETPAHYARDLHILGQLFGNAARADELSARFQAYAERVAQATAGLAETERPRVLLLVYTDRDGAAAFNVPSPAWIQTMLVEMAGGTPAWKDAALGDGWTKVGIEQIAAWDADQIYIIAYFNPVGEVIETLKADPQWQGLRAVKEGQLYGFPGDYYSWDQPDPRWALGLMWLAGKVQPERFPDLDMDREIRAFYREMYGLDDAAFDQHVQPHLFGDLP